MHGNVAQLPVGGIERTRRDKHVQLDELATDVALVKSRAEEKDLKFLTYLLGMAELEVRRLREEDFNLIVEDTLATNEER